MKIVDLSYGGKLFRPKPLVHINDSHEMFIVCTSWSSKGASTEACNAISSIFSKLSEDNEATTPFEFLSNLSTEQNNLRTSVLLANKELCTAWNSKEYKNACEIVACVKKGQQLSWVQIGNPSLFLKKDGHPTISIGSQKDLSFDYSTYEALPPLPDQLFGVNEHLSLQIGSSRVAEHDKLILLSHSQIPSFLQISLQTQSLDMMAQKLSDKLPNSPFWLAEVSFYR